MVVDLGADRTELLQGLHPSKSQYDARSSADRQVRIFDAIVEPATHFAAVQIAGFAHRCRVGSQPIGDDLFNRAMALQRFLHEPQSRRFVPFPGDVAFQHLAFVINGPPRCLVRTTGLQRCAATVETAHTASPQAGSPPAMNENNGTGWQVFEGEACLCPTPIATSSPSGAVALTVPVILSRQSNNGCCVANFRCTN